MEGYSAGLLYRFDLTRRGENGIALITHVGITGYLRQMFHLLMVAECISLVFGMRGPHHPRGHYHYQPNANIKLTQDSQVLQDVEHIKEDLMNIVSEEQAREMTPEELEFHYFTLHDFDNNTKLDGLEILQAIHHSTHHDAEEEHASSDIKDRVAPETSQSSPEDILYFTELIDEVLAEDDLDFDGFLSYAEYVLGRKKDQTKRDSLTRKK